MRRVRDRLVLQTVGAVVLGLILVAWVVEGAFGSAVEVLAESQRARAGAQALHMANELSFAVAAASSEEIDAAVAAFLKTRKVGTLRVQRMDGKALKQVGAEIPATALTRVVLSSDGSISDGDWSYAAAPILAEGKTIGHVVMGEQQTQAHEVRRSARIKVYLAYTLVLLLISGLVFVMGSRFSRPLEAMAVVARRVDTGDLTERRIPVQGNDEVAVLGKALGQMIETLATQVRAISTASSGVLESATSTMGAMSQVSQAATQQAAAIAEVSSAAEQVRRTSKTAVENARQIAESAEKSAHDSNAGRQAVDSSLAVMNRLREQVDAMAAAIEALRTRVTEVNEIIASVNNIAGQSNLLAVNASIEAAKAGEAGRGFAVVAQEVRNLAEQSRGATTRVRDTLGKIQHGIEEIVIMARSGRAAAEDGVQSVRNTGEVIGGLAGVIANTAQVARAIATGANEQVIGIGEIAEAMTGVNRTAHENLESTQQVEKSAQRLNAVARELESLTARYQLDAAAGGR